MYVSSIDLDVVSQIPPNDCLPFWPTTKLDAGKLEVRIAETSEHTEPFPYFKSHNSVLKLNNKVSFHYC